MNVISTLSFLIESKKLNQITIDISYKTHSNIRLTLNSRNAISFSKDEYLGSLIQEKSDAIFNSTIMLLLYIEIIPVIVQNYQSGLLNNQWNADKCVEFLQHVADVLFSKVKHRINNLKTDHEQYYFMA